ncbi:MAG: mannan-binding protein [Spirulina sp.]
MKNTIKADARADDPCGCDRLAIEQILNNSVAPPICEATCADYGGWNGRWTNEYPAAQAGSVCGCNACSLF